MSARLKVRGMIRWSAYSDVQEEIRGLCKTVFDKIESLNITTGIISDSCKIKNFCAKCLLMSSLFLLFFEKLLMKSLDNFVSSYKPASSPSVFLCATFQAIFKISFCYNVNSTPKLIICLYTLVTNYLNVLNVC